MELSTRCPECETIFPVSMEQLQLRKGYIRCIQCAHIFDGFEAAVPATGSAAGPRAASSEPMQPFSIGAARDLPASAEPAREHSIPATSPVASPGASIEPRIPASTPAASHEVQSEPRIPAVVRQRNDLRKSAVPATDPFTISDPPSWAPRERGEPVVSAHGVGKAPSFTVGPAEPEQADDDVDNDDYLYIEPRATRRSEQYRPEFMAEAGAGRAWLTPVWLLLTILGLVLLIAQGVYIYRSQLANAFPNLRPVLESACDRLACSVPYDRRIEAIAITGSALRSTGAPEGEVSNLVLEVVLRNTFERPQEWPTLVLDLKDASGTVVVRRNLGPEIWVPETLRSDPFAANSELRAQIPVAVKGLQANGYQIDKFFP